MLPRESEATATGCAIVAFTPGLPSSVKTQSVPAKVVITCCAGALAARSKPSVNGGSLSTSPLQHPRFLDFTYSGGLCCGTAVVALRQNQRHCIARRDSARHQHIYL